MIFGAGSFGSSPYASNEAIVTPDPPLPPAVETILEYYADLLILQYKPLPKARDTIRLFTDQSVCDGFMYDVAAAFNLDTAVGDQLDILGRIVGVPRVIYTFELGDTFFNFTDYYETPDILRGFGDYTDSPYDPDDYLFYTYSRYNNISVTLDDDDMRTLIRMKIELNNSYSSFAFIKQFVYDWFDDVVVEDNLDMSLTYTIAASFNTLTRAAFYLKMLPTPAGVRASYIFQ